MGNDRVGIGSVVLEQAESLRTGGTSITFFKNGWKVLDAIGVGSQLRSQYLEIQGYAVCSCFWSMDLHILPHIYFTNKGCDTGSVQGFLLHLIVQV